MLLSHINFRFLLVAFATSSIITYCSQHKIIKIPSICSEELSSLNELMDILQRHDIRDIRTREKLQKFFRNEEEEDKFISSLIYKIREKESFYGRVSSYKIIDISYEENICTFDVQISLEKRYPIENIKIYESISLINENGSHYIRPPKYVGEIKERREMPYYY